MARVFVITGPSGVGKGTLIRGLMERLPGLELSVSATTRSPRAGEREGVEYHFLPREEFDRRVADGEFVEHADYAGRSYGTLRSELSDRLEQGVPVVLEIEVQGARQVRAAMPEAVQVFIAPPSLEALRTRLIGPSRSSRLSPSSAMSSSTTAWTTRSSASRRSSPASSKAELPPGARRARARAGTHGRLHSEVNQERQHNSDLPPNRPPAGES
jgi:guanylate kinase